MKTAVVVGATGLTGSALVRQLIKDARFAAVTAITRRPTGLSHAKFREVIVDFEKPQLWTEHVRADAAFSALGTTKKEAGSLAAQRRVDFDYQFGFAEAAAKHGVPSFVLLSAMGASTTSNFAFTRMKGELDDAVSALKFTRLRIVRPGMLDGKRVKLRPAERASNAMMRIITGLGIAPQFRPISVETVAKAMIATVFDGSEQRRIYTLGEVFALAESDV